MSTNSNKVLLSKMNFEELCAILSAWELVYIPKKYTVKNHKLVPFIFLISLLINQ